MFYDDPDILFISTHQAGSFPNTGALKEVGAGDGEGASINLPIPGVGRWIQCPCICQAYMQFSSDWSSILISFTSQCARRQSHLVPAGDSGDAAMRAALEEIVLPAAQRFQPDIILVSSVVTALQQPCTVELARGSVAAELIKWHRHQSSEACDCHLLHQFGLAIDWVYKRVAN